MSKQRWFANLVLIGAALGSIAAGAMAFQTARSYSVGLRQLLFVGGPILLGFALLACLRLPIDLRATLAVTLLSLVVAAFGAEAYLRELPLLRVRWAARHFGIPYDSRSQYEVVRDLRAQGKDAWPAGFPSWQGFRLENEGILPLGGISRVQTVFCNEMGRYVLYSSDEHGFHNPEGIWSSGKIEIAALGDSFTQGSCVESGQNFVARLRQARPATLNLGMLGNGPLLMLAGLREFLVDLRPRIVLWVYTEGNDLTFDLHRERKQALLMEYLRPGHRQGLVEEQSRIDELLRGLIEREYDRRSDGMAPERTFSRFFKLWALRQALGLYVGQDDPRRIREDIPLFREILEQAQIATHGWGGELYFVYLPAEARYFDGKWKREHDWLRDRVLGIVSELRIPLIDLDPSISGHPHVPDLYAFRGGHFSPAGYQLAAETILKALPLPASEGPGPGSASTSVSALRSSSSEGAPGRTRTRVGPARDRARVR